MWKIFFYFYDFFSYGHSLICQISRKWPKTYWSHKSFNDKKLVFYEIVSSYGLFSWGCSEILISCFKIMGPFLKKFFWLNSLKMVRNISGLMPLIGSWDPYKWPDSIKLKIDQILIHSIVFSPEPYWGQARLIAQITL